MRKINWRPWRPVLVDHIEKVEEVVLWEYDESGRLYKSDLCDPASNRPIIIWAQVTLIGGGGHFGWWPHEFGFTYDGYVFGWPGKRLSSLPEHEYYFRKSLWYSIADRDYIFGELTKGMFDSRR